MNIHSTPTLSGSIMDYCINPDITKSTLNKEKDVDKAAEIGRAHV